MQAYAFYLPQFHEIEENNLWWGQGFTEWTNVKRAQKLFKEHDQPRRPKDDFYYTLDNADTLRWQAQLAQEHALDGFIFYHYYFEGRMLLQKPAELLLANSDIPMNFFFCWANHTWNRAWKNSREVLLEQTYGDESSWEAHFRYLLPFFSDPRYKKIDNMPVFMLFQPNIEEKCGIFDYFDKRCRESGFAGLYAIESYNGIKPLADFNRDMSPKTCAVVRREPDYSVGEIIKGRSLFARFMVKARRVLVELGKTSSVRKYNGDAVYRQAMKNLTLDVDGRKLISGAFFEFDNTPRHSARGMIISPVSRDVFMEYLDAVHASGGDMLFINAWNEWAEGMYLEPDEVRGTRYLDWIAEWKNSHP